ncbi:hypothetical protein [Acinetobacter proteolyticus]|nr:hypothetical protein [Acinetobacter proteolyticus]
MRGRDGINTIIFIIRRIVFTDYEHQALITDLIQHGLVLVLV